MAKRDRLKEIEAQTGIALEELIPALLTELGTQMAVADRLEVSQATISAWLAQNGYVSRIVWEKEDEHAASV